VSALADRREALYSAIEGLVPDVRCIREPGAQGNPPIVYVGPPSLTWQDYGFGPTTAVYEVVLAVAADERAVDRLFDLLGPVTDAIDGSREAEASVVSAEPGVWQAGNSNLPAYFIRAEAAV
jgi:hypothetical protein